MTFQLLDGDCLDALAEMPEASVDAVVTDPPYGLEFMGKDWDGADGFRRSLNKADTDRENQFGRASRTSPEYRAGQTFQVWTEAWATELLRVLKPGGHFLAFGGTRTYHRLACGIEDAGFEVRDCLAWMYGSGFPKSLDVSKAIDRKRDDLDDIYRVTEWIREARDAAGIGNREIDEAFGFHGMAGHWTSSKSQPAVPTLDQVPQLLEVLGVDPDDVPQEIRRLLYDLNGKKGQPGENWSKREVTGERSVPLGHSFAGSTYRGDDTGSVDYLDTAPATPAAQKWQGWGTALKPAFEPIILARKPLTGTVAANVQEFGTGALNIDGGRVGTDGGTRKANPAKRPSVSAYGDGLNGGGVAALDAGRWPANVILDPEAGAMLDEQTGELHSQDPATRNSSSPRSGVIGFADGGSPHYGDTGGASRFYYCAKASRAERNAGLDGFEEKALRWSSGEQSPGTFQAEGTHKAARNHHPTVKPIDLMRYLVRLVTPPGGVVLDPFTGSGTTGIAANLEGFEFVGIEREAEYREIAEARLKWWADQEGDTAEILQRAGLAEKREREAKESGQTSLFDEEAA